MQSPSLREREGGGGGVMMNLFVTSWHILYLEFVCRVNATTKKISFVGFLFFLFFFKVDLVSLS